MLVEHGIDDVDEGLIAIEEPVAAGEEIPFKPAFALMLAQHFHHAPLGSEKFILRVNRSAPLAVGGLEYRLQTVRQRLVGPEDAKVALWIIQLHDVAQKAPEHVRVARAAAAR